MKNFTIILATEVSYQKLFKLSLGSIKSIDLQFVQETSQLLKLANQLERPILIGDSHYLSDAIIEKLKNANKQLVVISLDEPNQKICKLSDYHLSKSTISLNSLRGLLAKVATESPKLAMAS